MGSLIAGSLIGASVIIGLLLTKSLQPIANQTTSSTPQSGIPQTTNTSNPTPKQPSQPTVKSTTTQQSTPALSSTPSPPTAIVPKQSHTPKPALSSTSLSSTNDYSWLSEKLVTDADLFGRSAFELDILRNSIYARHGRQFSNEALQDYFNHQPWYRPVYSPDKFPDSLLSSLEQQNAVYILQYQNSHGLRWVP